jgi:hypothetical protein
MTDFQEHLMLENLISYDENNKREDHTTKLPYNNADAPLMLMFTNGFSSLKLTGDIIYNYIMGTDMYVFHYMKSDEHHSISNSMGWTKNDYVLFTMVVIPEKYLSNSNCKAKTLWSLY